MLQQPFHGAFAHLPNPVHNFACFASVARPLTLKSDSQAVESTLPLGSGLQGAATPATAPATAPAAAATAVEAPKHAAAPSQTSVAVAQTEAASPAVAPNTGAVSVILSISKLFSM